MVKIKDEKGMTLVELLVALLLTFTMLPSTISG